MKWICGPKTGSHETEEKPLIKRCLLRAAFRGFRWFSVQTKKSPNNSTTTVDGWYSASVDMVKFPIV